MLPPEILSIIFESLDIASLVALCQTDTAWRSAISDDDFRRVCCREYSMDSQRHFPSRQTWAESAKAWTSRQLLICKERPVSADKNVPPVYTSSEWPVQVDKPLPLDFRVLFPTFSLRDMNQDYRVHDDGFSWEDENRQTCYVNLAGYSTESLENPVDVYTCSNGIQFRLPPTTSARYEFVRATPTTKVRDVEGIWTIIVPYDGGPGEATDQSVASIVVASSSEAVAWYDCRTATLRVKHSRSGLECDYEVQQDHWRTRKVELFVYGVKVIVVVTIMHYSDWTVHIRQINDIYKVENNQIQLIEENEKSWGQVVWYDGLRLANFRERTEVLMDPFDRNDWIVFDPKSLPLLNMLQVPFERQYAIGFDINHDVVCLWNIETNDYFDLQPFGNVMSFVGVTGGKLNVRLFTEDYVHNEMLRQVCKVSDIISPQRQRWWHDIPDSGQYR